MKYTPHFQKKLEEQLSQNGYTVRYEKGNFKSGYCILENKKVIVVNKFVPIESKINTLLELMQLFAPQQAAQMTLTPVAHDEATHHDNMTTPQE